MGELVLYLPEVDDGSSVHFFKATSENGSLKTVNKNCTKPHFLTLLERDWKNSQQGIDTWCRTATGYNWIQSTPVQMMAAGPTTLGAFHKSGSIIYK